MVSREEIKRLAMSYDTQVSRAFRKALGIGSPPRRHRRRARVRAERFDGIGECFANHGSPMDGGAC